MKKENRSLLPDLQHSRACSPCVRIGPLAILILAGGTLAFAVYISFLYFLWYGAPDSGLWHIIIVRSWAARVVTITSIVIRGALTLQGGVCVSMLAAIDLERSSVPLDSVGRVSLIRADGDKGLVPVLTGFTSPPPFSPSSPRLSYSPTLPSGRPPATPRR